MLRASVISVTSALVPSRLSSEATIADVAVYGDVAYAEEGAIDLSPYANVKAWMGRVEKLPGFKKYADLLPQQDAA